MKAKEICLAILAAESEQAVQQIIDASTEMRNAKNWRPLDDRETNFNVTSNQASDGGKALTELMTNMVDAVLTKHAHQHKIDPKGPKAPKNMYEAVESLIRHMKGGKLVNLDPKDPWLKDFAQKNLLIGITGARNKGEGLPCYTFADNGEGQKPQDFPKTFLSLSEGNKKSIPFVQGKYNMGSSGVLAYCGMRWFKLILSRRYDGKSPWGWTLMRRRPTSGMPVAEYFVLPDGSIPSFESDVLYPFHKRDGKRYDGAHRSSGTIIKLYDYQVGSKFTAFRSREALNENLVETILPFRLLDLRQTPDPKRGADRAEGIDPRPFYGMEFLLLHSHKESDLDEEDDAVGIEHMEVATVDNPEFGRISIGAIPLKRRLPGWLHESSNRVFHSINGQVQFKQTRGYLSQTCGFPALKDRIVIVVDASELSEEAHNLIWKGDREHINNTIMGERYKEQVTAAIKESDTLKDLQHRFALEELSQASKDEPNNLFQQLVDSDRNLAGLLSNRDPVIRLPSSPDGNGGTDKGPGKFEGKYSPTFLRIDTKMLEGGLDVPINRTKAILARTDAENGYFSRTENSGQLIINDDVKECFSIRRHLLNGRLSVFLEPIEAKLRVGQKFTCNLTLEDPAISKPLKAELTIRIVNKYIEAKTPKPPAPPNPPTPKPGNKNKSGSGTDAPTHGLPIYRLLTSDGRNIGGEPTEPWPAGFTENDGGFVYDVTATEVVYKINYDNTYHLKYRAQQRGDISRDAITAKYILGMRILMLGYEHAFRLMKEPANGMAEYNDQFRQVAARGAATTVLALAENLPKIVDSSAVNRDVE